MKKVFSIALTLLTALAIVLLATNAKAEEVLGDELIVNGTFTTNVSGGVATLNKLDSFAGGDWTPDGHTYLAEDPIKDYVIRMDYSAAGDNMYIMVPLETAADDVVKVSLDYYVVGTCTNFGLGFWCTSAGARLLEHVFAGAPTDGWVHAEWTYEAATEAVTYDSMHIWCVGQTEGSQAFIKNFKVTKNDDTTNLITSGDFNSYEEFLVSDSATLTDTADDYFNTGVNARYTGTSVIVENGSFAHGLAMAEGKYKVAFDCTMGESVTGTISFVNGTETVLSMPLEAAFNKEITLESAALQIVFASTGKIEIDNLSVRMYEQVATSYADWYESKSTTVNGDFEKFEVGTIFSEVQQEGAWGSVSLDAPGHIEEKDGSKVLQINTDGTHTYSSAFLMLPDTLEVGNVLRLRYDLKIEGSDIRVLNSCLVGGSNTSYYTIELLTLKNSNWESGTTKTSGAEKVNYPIKVTALENSWYQVQIDFELTSRDLIQTDSIRWLLSSTNSEDKLYIDNVNLYYLTEEEPVTEIEVSSVSFTDGTSVSLKVGDTKELAVSVLPEDADDKSLTFSSSNEAVATVDATGKVTAVSKGACSITVRSANGKTAEIAIVVSENSQNSGDTTPSTPSTTKKGCKGALGITLIASLGLLGTAAIVYKKRREIK